MPLERIGLCNPTHESMVHICCAYGAYNSLINYVNSRSDRFYIDQSEKLLIKASDKAWSVFAEAYRAEAQDFKVNAPCYSLHAWLDWRLNIEDPMQIQSAPLLPEPICNHTDVVTNDSDPELFSHFLQNVDLPPDNLLDHPQPLAGVDGIPGPLQLLAVHPVLAHGVLAGASNHMSHAETPD